LLGCANTVAGRKTTDPATNAEINTVKGYRFMLKQITTNPCGKINHFS